MYCCVAKCRNTSKKDKLKKIQFYCFPSNSPFLPWLSEKRESWINAVKKHTRNPDTWVPTKATRICSAHFVGNMKSENPLNPAYVPTIFPKKRAKMVETNVVESSSSEDSNESSLQTEGLSKCVYAEVSAKPRAGHSELPRGPAKQSVECQTDLSDLVNEDQNPVTYIFCNLVNLNGVCTAEVQAHIVTTKPIKTENRDISPINKFVWVSIPKH